MGRPRVLWARYDPWKHRRREIVKPDALVSEIPAKITVSSTSNLVCVCGAGHLNCILVIDGFLRMEGRWAALSKSLVIYCKIHFFQIPTSRSDVIAEEDSLLSVSSVPRYPQECDLRAEIQKNSRVLAATGNKIASPGIAILASLKVSLRTLGKCGLVIGSFQQGRPDSQIEVGTEVSNRMRISG